MCISRWDAWNERWGTKYPQDKLVQFCFRTFAPERRPFVRALDLGCGSGVHTVFLAAEGFPVTGVDISEVGIANTRRKLDALGLNAVLRRESADVLDFPPDSFDMVVCVGVYESTGPAIARASVRRVSEILRPGARGFFLFASDRDDAVKRDDTWGMHGYTRTEVEEMFAQGFFEVCLDRSVTTYRNGSFEQNEWLVMLER